MRKVLMGVTIAALAATSASARADEQGGATTSGTPPPTSTTTTSGSPATLTSAEAVTAEAVPIPAPVPNRSESVTLSQRIRPNRPMLATGGVLLLGAYVPTAVLTATNDQDRSLYIPVVGPWMHLADRRSEEDSGVGVLIAASGIVQGLGALLMVTSLLVPERVPAATIQAGNVKINVTPTTLGRGAPAIGAVAAF